MVFNDFKILGALSGYDDSASASMLTPDSRAQVTSHNELKHTHVSHDGRSIVAMVPPHFLHQRQ